MQIQKLLNVPSKPDDTTSVLQAVSKLIADRLSVNAVKQEQAKADKGGAATTPKKETNTVQLNIESVNLGFDTNGKHRKTRVNRPITSL